MKRLIVATSMALLMVGCVDTAPECAGDDVKDLVMNFAKQKGYKNLENAELTAIRTESKSDRKEESTCQAKIVYPTGEQTEIFYTAKTTSDGEVYVRVYGLK